MAKGIKVGSSLRLTSPIPVLVNSVYATEAERIAPGQLRHTSWDYHQEDNGTYWRIKPLAQCLLIDGVTAATQFGTWGTLAAHWIQRDVPAVVPPPPPTAGGTVVPLPAIAPLIKAGPQDLPLAVNGLVYILVLFVTEPNGYTRILVPNTDYTYANLVISLKASAVVKVDDRIGGIYTSNAALPVDTTVPVTSTLALPSLTATPSPTFNPTY